MPTSGSIAGLAVPMFWCSLEKEFVAQSQLFHSVTNSLISEVGSLLAAWTDVMGKDH
jgi:hypothetical protein